MFTHPQGDPMTVAPTTSAHPASRDVSWFAALCPADPVPLGMPGSDPCSGRKHFSTIIQETEDHRFGDILCPPSSQVGQYGLYSAAGNAPPTLEGNSLAARDVARCSQ